MSMKTIFRLFLSFGIIIQFSCNSHEFVSLRQTMDLSGKWHFAMDFARMGVNKKWFSKTRTDTIHLPGTMSVNNKGISNLNQGETMHLSRERMYEGWTWCQKYVTIDESWSNKEIFLNQERTNPAKVWVDQQLISENTTNLTPQKYNLTKVLTPGRHSITNCKRSRIYCCLSSGIFV